MRILITGVSGLLGNTLATNLHELGHEVYGTVFHHPHEIDGVGIQNLDLTEFPTLTAILGALHPEVILNAAALSQPAVCNAIPENSRELNIDLPMVLARWVEQYDSRLIHFSTDMVFDGQEGNYSPESSTNPKNLYGHHKLKGEQEVAETAPDHSLILRLPILMGNSPSKRRSVHEALFGSWNKNKKSVLFEDEFRQPVSVENVATLCHELLDKPAINGLHHWAGAEAISRYEMGKQIAAHFEVSEDLLQPVIAKENPKLADRPLNLTFDCTSLLELVDTKPATFAEQLPKLIQPELDET